MSNKNIARGYDKVKEKIVMPEIHYKIVVKTIEEIENQFFGPHDKLKILDFGCGKGFLLKHLESKGYKLYGYDISKELVDIARKNSKLSKIYNNLPDNNKYDFIIFPK